MSDNGRRIINIIISLLAAIVAWTFVVYNDDPMTEVTYKDVPIIFEGEATLVNRGLGVSQVSSDTIDVKLRQMRIHTGDISANSISVIADVSEAVEGENGIAYRKIYLFLFIIFGMAYLFLFLPFVSPDEPSHYLSAYRISDLLLGQIGQLGDKRLLMRMEDYQFFQQKKYVLDPKYYMAVTESMHLHRHQTGYVIAAGPMVTNSIFSYFPAGFGMAVARVLNLSGAMTFYFGTSCCRILFL